MSIWYTEEANGHFCSISVINLNTFHDFVMLFVNNRGVSYLKFRFSLKMRQTLLNNVLFVVLFSHSNELYPKHENVLSLLIHI